MLKIQQFKNILVSYLPHSVTNFLLRVIRGARKANPVSAYYCKALSGESAYNICVNSDLTISCNCQDYDGSGHLGDLRLNSLEEIFHGETAQSFRDSLASNKLPIPTCEICIELASVSKKIAREKAGKFMLPRKGIMVENTVTCNLACLACDRGVVETRTSRVGVPGGRIMSLDEVRQVAEEVQKNDIKLVAYLNLGEPFLSKRVHSEMTIMRELNPTATFVVSTNGMFIDQRSKQEAALMFDRITFSIDGSSQALVEKYQVGMNFDRAVKNMMDLVHLRDTRSLSKPVIQWKYVVFAWNDSDEDINRAIEMAKEAGADIICFAKGYMPDPRGMSKRFVRSTFFRNLGKESWKGREIVLREHQ